MRERGRGAPAACALLCARAVKTTLLVLLTVAACGSDGDTGPDDNVTFDALPEATRQQFVAWKARPIKDCAWEQAFPSIADHLEESRALRDRTYPRSSCCSCKRQQPRVETE